MKICARYNESDCSGRITWEHCWIYAGKQVNEAWAIIGLCEYHHLGAGLDKDLNRYISLLRARPEDLAKYPKKDWRTEYRRLELKYAEKSLSHISRYCRKW